MSEIGHQVVRFHLEGIRSIDIAHRLNVAQSTVHYHLRKLKQRKSEPKRRRSSTPRTASAQVRTREQVADMLAAGIPRIEIARTLGIGKSTVSYHASRLGAEIDERCRRRYDWTVVQEYYDQGNSVRDCIRAFGFSPASWHQAVKRGLVTPRPGFAPADAVFVADTYRNRGHLKERLLRMGLKSNRCERCGLTEWRGTPITMALHHINGDRLDNRVENLELLCPNCHSQTDTFGGRNSSRLALVRDLRKGGQEAPATPDGGPGEGDDPLAA